MSATIYLPRHVRLSTEVLFQQLKDQAVLLDLVNERYIGLNAVGVRIWQLLSEDADTLRVVTQLLHEYDVDETTLRSEVAAFIVRLTEYGIAQVESKYEGADINVAYGSDE